MHLQIRPLSIVGGYKKWGGLGEAMGKFFGNEHYELEGYNHDDRDVVR
jgi:hypothetical protein